MADTHANPTPIRWPEQLDAHRRYLWGVCYRLTGDVADAEDLVQATFERALRRPPEDLERPWRPWLTRVATNLAIDLLRRRGQQAYDGPWLPAPIEELLEVEGWTREHHGGELGELEIHYDQHESARYAFLLALETLDPRSRAVLILRDVLGYDGPEVASFLELTAANVRVILHRARKALASARTNARSVAEQHAALHDARVREAIERLMLAISSRDVDTLAQLLAEDVRASSDAGGEFVAARKLVRSRASVSSLLLGLGKLAPVWIELRSLNGEPAIVAEMPPTPIRTARHVVLRLELDANGQIAELHIVLASRKLGAVALAPGVGEALV